MVPAVALSGFPPQVRFSGLSFSYNVAYAVCGGLTPVLLSLALKDHPAAPSHYMLAMSAMGVGLGLYVAVRKRRTGGEAAPAPAPTLSPRGADS